ncbi:MAG TPA: hypothetical protein VIE86_04020 [Nitrososphaera sp.]
MNGSNHIVYFVLCRTYGPSISHKQDGKGIEHMILVAVGSAVIGMMLLVTSLILYTVSALLREKVQRQLDLMTSRAR